jgi:predicted glutamine amidotransferase
MCELLGMSANTPTDICFSFSGLMERGGNTGPHKDGFGVAFYDGKGYRCFKDHQPSCESVVAKLIQKFSIKSKAVISHIRQANRGGVSLVNTHPFTRALWGEYWTFAHNGQMSEFDALEVGRYAPVGETDSEHAFCFILNTLATSFQTKPDEDLLYDTIHQCCKQLRALGVFNMLLSNGDMMISFCSNNLHFITRQAPFEHANLIDADVSLDFSRVTNHTDVVTVIATKPLTDNEMWTKFEQGDFKVFKEGKVLHSDN